MGGKNFSLNEIIQIDACTNCMLCAEVCPAVSITQDGHLSGMYRLERLRRLLRSRSALLKWIYPKKRTEDDLDEFSNTVFRCTLCGRCQEICPSGILMKDIWLSLRQDLVQSKFYPKKVDVIRENVLKSHNVFAEDNEERSEWVEDLDSPPDHGFIKDSAEVVYFTGCVSAYFPMAQTIPMSLVEVLEAAKIDFTLLGQDEYCCGFPFLGAGLRDQIHNIINHNIEAVKKKKASKVIFACPSCYRMWKEYYPKEFDLYHVTQFLREIISKGRIGFKNLDMTVTYHDPCDLGRGSGEYEAPRDIINRIPGIKLIEIDQNRDKCTCCGGGGNLEMIDSRLSGDIAGAKIDEVLNTGADAVVTACQQCVRTMNSFVRKNKIKLQVMDIVQLVQKAMEG